MRLIKCAGIFVFLFVFNAEALAAQCVHKNIVSQHKALVMSMYHYFDSLTVPSLHKKDLKRFYRPNVEMIFNDRLVSSGIDQFYDHFKLVLSKSRRHSFVFPKNAIIADGHRLAIKYKIKSNDDVYYVIAFFSFKDDKISKWNEVVAKASAQKMGLAEKPK